MPSDTTASNNVNQETDLLNLTENLTQLSLYLNLGLMAICLLGIYLIYLAIKNKSIQGQDIDKLIELGKWFIISVAIVSSTSIISDGFKQKELAMKEYESKYKMETEKLTSHMEDFERYTEIILSADMEKKRFLSDYFANVAIGERQKGWQAYNKLVKDDIDKIKNITEKEDKLKEKAQTILSEPEKKDVEQQLKALKEKKAELSQSIITQEWAIITGNDTSAKASVDEVNKIKEYSVGMYKKGDNYVTVVKPFLNRSEALIALSEILKNGRNVRGDSYIVNFQSWCKNPQEIEIKEIKIVGKPRNTITECK